MDPSVSLKTNCFLNNKIIPCIPLVLHGNEFTTDSKKR